MTLEVDYHGQLFRPLLSPASFRTNTFNVKRIQDSLEKSNVCDVEGHFLRLRFCNKVGCSKWSPKINVAKRPSEDNKMEINVYEMPPDSVQIQWKAALFIPTSHRSSTLQHYYFDLKVANLTSKETTFYEKVKSKQFPRNLKCGDLRVVPNLIRSTVRP